ncbi:MAG: anthranilate synthase component I family protein [Terriglobales bacterium]
MPLPASVSLLFPDVQRLAEGYNLIPLTCTFLADLDTPVAAYLNSLRGGRGTHSYLLESVEGGERIGRYSFLGVQPDLLLRQRRGRVASRSSHRFPGSSSPRWSPWRPSPLSLLDLIRAEVQRRRLAPTPATLPFLAGAVGFLGYDMVRSFESLPSHARNDLSTDEALLMFFSRQVIFDHVRRQITLVACVRTEAAVGAESDSLESEYQLACDDLQAMAARLQRRPRLPRTPVESGPLHVFPNWERPGFEAAVDRARDYIAAGDIFQVVLSQRFDIATSAAPFQVYRTLRAINPSPYMFFLQMGRLALAGASPELLVQVRRRDLVYRPIAGTRPRGADEPSDAELSRELLADEKERAEHVMLVDLGRNDVGRVAAPGSISVPTLMSVEKYSHVQHLVSEVRGRLAADRDMFDALAACFPAGTLTGAPKIRAMEIIEELEPTRRGPYGGAVVNLDFSGNLSACILIRSILFRHGMASVQAGAGIVADSVPEREFVECVNKARAMIRALEQARCS